MDRLYRFTAEGFNQAKKAGIFDYPERISLVHGIVMEEPQPTANCVALTNLLSRQLRSAMQKRFVVYGRRPLEVDSCSQPTTDVLVVTGKNTDYQDRHPCSKDTALVVEISNTTADYDLGEKALLYAQAGISDYWGVLVKDNAIMVHREPSPEGYQNISRLTGTDTLSPLAMPQVSWTINELLGRTEAQ